MVTITSRYLVEQIVARDFDTFSGYVLEKMFRELYVETHQFNKVGNYWDSGQVNEIEWLALSLSDIPKDGRIS